jgi:hypothetical protein
VEGTVPKPNFFIVGGPKCGTTALYIYLKNHPEIFMSRIKEPQFFAADIFGDQRTVRTLADYLSCFTAARHEKRIGEASTAYLGCRSAAQEIKAFNPNAQIIIALRNPVEVMYAEHSERVFCNVEHIRNFKAALESSEERTWRTGPFKNQRVIRLRYRDAARFSQQVGRYCEVFGRENVHIIIYDDFRLNPPNVYKQLLDFLQVSSDSEIDYPVINANRRARSMAVQDFLRHPPRPVRRFSQFIPRGWRSALVGCLHKLNVVYEPRPPMDQELRRRLQKEYEPEVEELSRLLDRDLSAWCRS